MTQCKLVYKTKALKELDASIFTVFKEELLHENPDQISELHGFAFFFHYSHHKIAIVNFFILLETIR
jgi:hypothetical protein